MLTLLLFIIIIAIAIATQSAMLEKKTNLYIIYIIHIIDLICENDRKKRIRN
jgi:hypothetical protein